MTFKQTLKTKIVWVFIVIAFSDFANSSQIAKETLGENVSSSVRAANTDNSKVGTKYSFEDLLVQGQYHFSEEVVTTVEEEKVLDSLLGIRRDYKDKLKETQTQF